MGGNNNNLAKRNNYFQSHIESLVGSENAVYDNAKVAQKNRDVSQGSVGS
jgi:hypothetical protein